MPNNIDDEELRLLGLANLCAQRVEFVIYGLAVHFPASAISDQKRISKTSPEDFFRGDPSELKITLGQLSKAMGGALGIDPVRLGKFVDDRNLLAHNFFRTFHASIDGVANRLDQHEFLRAFIRDAVSLEHALVNLVQEIRRLAAEKPAYAHLHPTVEEISKFEDYYSRIVAEAAVRESASVL